MRSLTRSHQHRSPARRAGVAACPTVGPSETEPDNSPPPASDGRTDFTLGLTWRVVDEDISEAGLPTVAVRVAAVLGGSYDVGLPTAIGDGADGVDAALIVGRIFAQRIGVSGELGFRNRNDDVPDATFLNLTGYFLLSPRLILEAQCHRTDSDGDLNICGPCGAPSPPGAPENFPLVAEELERSRWVRRSPSPTGSASDSSGSTSSTAAIRASSTPSPSTRPTGSTYTRPATDARFLTSGAVGAGEKGRSGRPAPGVEDLPEVVPGQRPVGHVLLQRRGVVRTWRAVEDAERLG